MSTPKKAGNTADPEDKKQSMRKSGLFRSKKVLSGRAKNKYREKLNDGEKEKAIPQSNIRRVKSASDLTEGLTVQWKLSRIRTLLDRIEELNGLNEEGLFRISGTGRNVTALWETFGSDGSLPPATETDVNDISSLMKKYLKSQPEPLTPYSMYHLFVDSYVEDDDDQAEEGQREGEGEGEDQGEGKEDVVVSKINQSLTRAVQLLPAANAAALKTIITFLEKTSQNQDVNKMNVTNLGVVFGPLLMQPEEVGHDYIFLVRRQCFIVEALITGVDTIFADISTDVPDEDMCEAASQRTPMPKLVVPAGVATNNHSSIAGALSPRGMCGGGEKKEEAIHNAFAAWAGDDSGKTSRKDRKAVKDQEKRDKLQAHLERKMVLRERKEQRGKDRDRDQEKKKKKDKVALEKKKVEAEVVVATMPVTPTKRARVDMTTIKRKKNINEAFLAWAGDDGEQNDEDSKNLTRSISAKGLSGRVDVRQLNFDAISSGGDDGASKCKSARESRPTSGDFDPRANANKFKLPAIPARPSGAGAAASSSVASPSGPPNFRRHQRNKSEGYIASKAVRRMAPPIPAPGLKPRSRGPPNSAAIPSVSPRQLSPTAPSTTIPPSASASEPAPLSSPSPSTPTPTSSSVKPPPLPASKAPAPMAAVSPRSNQPTARRATSSDCPPRRSTLSSDTGPTRSPRRPTESPGRPPRRPSDAPTLPPRRPTVDADSALRPNPPRVQSHPPERPAVRQERKLSRTTPVETTPTASILQPIAPRSGRLREGDVAPDFLAIDSNGETVRLKDKLAEEKSVVLFFLPTIEEDSDAVQAQGRRMRDAHSLFFYANCEMIAISPDEDAAFQSAGLSEMGMPFRVIHDRDGHIASLYNVSARRVGRVTITIEEGGTILKIQSPQTVMSRGGSKDPVFTSVQALSVHMGKRCSNADQLPRT
eukprot:TRINITY_DN632_c0_g1_i1.p1 TRINITY_DN632_c0_g1~~TRINITY_DN632_c0_g1_i1.p1  ORF type:complete len:932 (+),score=204.96 TRINITY_DN632_c0_g1_i1:128-2923(+)